MITIDHNTELMSMDKLKKIIKKKEGRLEGYERCDAYWLLVVVDFFDLAQDQEIQVNNFERTDSTGFEKILVYKPEFGHILDVEKRQVNIRIKPTLARATGGQASLTH